MTRLALPLACVAVLVASAPAPALAEPTASVGLQPMFLVLPMVDATFEYSPTPHLGIAARAGYGRLWTTLLSASFYDVGGEASYYLTRPFSGWHVGAELFWAWGDTSSFLLDASSSNTSSSAERIAGAYAGYKWIGWHGLTAVFQLGVGHLDQKRSPDGPISEVIPVGNLFVGYSF